MDPRIQIRIRIHPKMSWIRNTEMQDPELDPQRSQYGSGTQLAVSPTLRTVAIALSLESLLTSGTRKICYHLAGSGSLPEAWNVRHGGFRINL
jgi:hypothetical protein